MMPASPSDSGHVRTPVRTVALCLARSWPRRWLTTCVRLLARVDSVYRVQPRLSCTRPRLGRTSRADHARSALQSP
jgi:hypothetical protein